MDTLLETKPKRYAQIAGSLYFSIAIAGGFSMGYLPSVIFVEGDPVQTAQNIIANQGLMRLGVLADVVVFLSEVVLSVMLFRLFKPVSETLSLVSALARIAMAVIIGLNAMLDLVPLTLLTSDTYASLLSSDELNALVMLFIELEQFGVTIWQMFFGLHLVILGYLVAKSGYGPRFLGQMMLVGSFGYTLQSFANVLELEYQFVFWIYAVLLVIVTIGEVAFALWLLIKGLNFDAFRKLNSASVGGKS